MTCARYTESDSGRIKVVTSATRPTGASRYIGQHIYETDTDRRLYFDGTGWVVLSEPEQAWSPSFALGVTVGNGAWTLAGLQRADGRMSFAGTFTLGSTSAVTGAIVLYLPVEAKRPPDARDVSGLAAISGGFYDLAGAGGNVIAVTFFALAAGGTYTSIAETSATVPASWTTGSTLTVRGTYAMASRYS